MTCVSNQGCLRSCHLLDPCASCELTPGTHALLFAYSVSAQCWCSLQVFPTVSQSNQSTIVSNSDISSRSQKLGKVLALSHSPWNMSLDPPDTKEGQRQYTLQATIANFLAPSKVQVTSHDLHSLRWKWKTPVCRGTWSSFRGHVPREFQRSLPCCVCQTRTWPMARPTWPIFHRPSVKHRRPTSSSSSPEVTMGVPADKKSARIMFRILDDVQQFRIKPRTIGLHHIS